MDTVRNLLNRLSLFWIAAWACVGIFFWSARNAGHATDTSRALGAFYQGFSWMATILAIAVVSGIVRAILNSIYDK